MADPVRRPHPDVAPAIEGTNVGASYHIARIDCMDGTEAQRHERIRNRRSREPILNPPVGEFCVALIRNSADVNASPERMNRRPEASLLAPYLGIAAERGFEGNFQNAAALATEFARRASLPENSNSTTSTNFQVAGKNFTLTQGVALDAAFTQAVTAARQPNATVPPRPTRSLEELYVTTDSCFRNVSTVSIGQCALAGRDQAALYLNQSSTVTQVEAPAATPTSTPTRTQQRRTTTRTN